MIAEGLDHADFIEARAPKPTMIITTTRDNFSIQGARESYLEAKRMYDAMNSGDKLIIVEDDNVHTSTHKNREAMYAFFQKQLNNPGSPEELNVVVPDVEELLVTETGQLTTTFESQSIYSLNAAIVQKQLSELIIKRREDPGRIKNIPALAARYSGFKYPNEMGNPVFSGRFVNSGYLLEKYLIPGSGDYMLPTVLLKPVSSTKNQIIMMFNSEGMEYAVNQDSLVHTLVKEGYAVLLSDLPGIGSMGPGYLKGDSYIQNVSYNQWFAAVLVGKSNVGLNSLNIGVIY